MEHDTLGQTDKYNAHPVYYLQTADYGVIGLMLTISGKTNSLHLMHKWLLSSSSNWCLLQIDRWKAENNIRISFGWQFHECHSSCILVDGQLYISHHIVGCYSRDIHVWNSICLNKHFVHHRHSNCSIHISPSVLQTETNQHLRGK